MRRQRAGFTLLEVLVTVAIVGMLASGATLAFANIYKWGRLSQGTDVVMGALREAQVRAFQDGNLWRLSVATGEAILYLEKATDPVGADRGCGSTGWDATPVRRYELPQGVTIGLRSEECVVFGQAGRVVSRAPYVSLPTGAHSPDTSVGSVPRLVDGRQLTDVDLSSSSFNPRGSDSGAVTWSIPDMPDLFVGLQEPRYISTLCVALISAIEFQVGYPGHINVVGSNVNKGLSLITEPDWTIPLLDVSGPPDPLDNSREPMCVNVPVNQQIRYLRIRVSGARPGTDYWAFDEIDLGARFFTIQYGTDKKIVEVDPTTGRVTSKNG
jgi:prepilin-type N-terminal cleavage/methylation domain-containing protein